MARVRQRLTVRAANVAQTIWRKFVLPGRQRHRRRRPSELSFSEMVISHCLHPRCPKQHDTLLPTRCFDMTMRAGPLQPESFKSQRVLQVLFSQRRVEHLARCCQYSTYLREGHLEADSNGAHGSTGASLKFQRRIIAHAWSSVIITLDVQG